MEQKIFWVLQDNEFDALVEEKLGFKYECVAENEWNNDTCYNTSFLKREGGDKEFFQKYSLPDIEKKMKGEALGKYSTMSFHDLLEYMVWKDMIPEGNYLIEVSW